MLYLCRKCLDLHKISRECLAGNKCFKGEKVRYFLLPVTVMLTLYFYVCKLWVLPLKTDLMKCYTSIGECGNWPQKYANSSCSFRLWTVFVVYLFGWVRDLQVCWCWEAWMTTCPLSVKRLDTARRCPSCQFFYLNVLFNQCSVVCPLFGNILHKHLAPQLFQNCKHFIRCLS